jgi:hypothetical protein
MNNQNRLIIRCLLACMLAAVLGYGSHAIAAEPPVFTLDFVAGQACNFDLRVEGFDSNQHFREFTDKNGNVVRSLLAGKGFELHFTNLITLATFSTKSNGAVEHTTFNADGTKTVTDTGHNVLIFFPTDVPAGPSTTLFVGRVVFTVAPPNDMFTLLDVSGRTVDICAVLS